MRISRRVISIVAVSTGLVLVSGFSAFAASYGGGSVQGYGAKKSLDNGTIVRLASEGSSEVVVATQSELQNMFGVTIDRGQQPVTISNSKLKNETFVAVSGTYNVLVSTQGGEIRAGDYVTLSSIDGVGMKAGTEEKTVLGRAADGFDGKGMRLSQTTLKDDKGNETKKVSIGVIPVTINIQRNPNEKSTKVEVPEFLERIGQAIAEKEVSPIRIYLSLAITAVSIIAAIAILYAGVRNGVISIGRNPMSKKSIFRALLEIILTSFVILTIGLFAVYLLLRL